MFRNTNCCGGHNGGVDRLTKICTDRIISTLTKDNWYEPYVLGKRTHGLLCQHAKEQVMRFMATNLTKLDNAAELLTVEDLEAVLRRMLCTTTSRGRCSSTGRLKRLCLRVCRDYKVLG